MLPPDNRQPLHEALRPPEGFVLDYAIGTTFSLDLLALLRAPLAFTQFEWEEADQKETLHPTVLLKALRDYANRMTLFCQAGHIHVPPAHRPLFTFLEGMVVQVNPPQGVFHPKVWALRFTKDDAVKYRLLVSSRNLTFDRCWDTLLVLEGGLTNRTNAIAANHPLGNFFEALPAMALQKSVGTEVRRQIKTFEYELRRTQFDWPEKVKKEHCEFLPLGLGETMPALDAYEKLLIVSPFVSETTLRSVCKQRPGKTCLISRPESLDALPAEVLQPFKKVWVLNPNAQPEPADADEALSNEISANGLSADLLNGLHAKLYIGETGAKVDVFTGSANATESGFQRNVEFMVKLEGRVQTWGIDTFLGKSNDDELTFGHLLQEYKIPDASTVQTPDVEEYLNRARHKLLPAGFEARVNKMPDAGVYGIILSWKKVADWPADVAVLCWPISLSGQVAKPLDMRASGEVHFEHLADASLTAFFAFELQAASGQSIRFVVQVPLQNAPQDRRERVLVNMLNDPEAFARFLALLLGDESAALAAMGIASSEGAASAVSHDWLAGGTLLEALLRALHRQPGQLDEVCAIVNDLRKVPGGERALPPGFDHIWESIWEARQRLKTP